MKNYLRPVLALIFACFAIFLFLSLLQTSAAAASPEQPSPAGVQVVSAGAAITATMHKNNFTLTGVGDSLYLFGGASDITGTVSNQLHRFDTSTETWHSVAVTSTGPAGRQGHAAAAFGNQLYILGGANQAGQKLDDVWRYNPATNTWSEVTQDTRPPARMGHTAVGTADNLLIYGGVMATPILTTSVWKFDPNTGYWTTYGMANPQGGRLGHSAGIIGDSLYLVGGGETPSVDFMQKTDFNGILYDSVTVTSTARPTPRRNQATVFLPASNSIMIFGGESITTSAPISDAWSFDIGKGEWTKLPDLPNAVTGLKAASWTSTSHSPAGRLPGALAGGVQVLIVGGKDAQGDLNPTSYVFDGAAYQPVVTQNYSLYIPLVRR